MPANTAAQNYAVDQLTGNKFLYVSAHTVDAPNASGSGEVTGGSYARQSLSWGSASGGAASTTGGPYSIPIPSGTTVRSVGLWDALSAGNFWGYLDISDEVFGADGNLSFDSLTYDYS